MICMVPKKLAIVSMMYQENMSEGQDHSSYIDQFTSFLLQLGKNEGESWMRVQNTSLARPCYIRWV